MYLVQTFSKKLKLFCVILNFLEYKKYPIKILNDSQWLRNHINCSTIYILIVGES